MAVSHGIGEIIGVVPRNDRDREAPATARALLLVHRHWHAPRELLIRVLPVSKLVLGAGCKVWDPTLRNLWRDVWMDKIGEARQNAKVMITGQGQGQGKW